MAFGSTTKSTKKKSPSSPELKKENAGLKEKNILLGEEVASLQAQLVEAQLSLSEALKPSKAERELTALKTALKELCVHHPSTNRQLQSYGLKDLL